MLHKSTCHKKWSPQTPVVQQCIVWEFYLGYLTKAIYLFIIGSFSSSFLGAGGSSQKVWGRGQKTV